MNKNNKPAIPGEHIDPATLKRGDQFTCNLMFTQATCIYMGSMKSGDGSVQHDFAPYVVTPGKPPDPFGSLTLKEGRDIGKDLPSPFGMTKITKDHQGWIANPDTSFGNMLDALNELQGIEETQGEEAAFNPATMMLTFLKHMPKEAMGEFKAMVKADKPKGKKAKAT